jgi:homoserine kinase type II
MAATIAYAQPVTTDATAASDAELLEAASLFLPDPPSSFSFERCKGGVNNAVYRLSVAPPTPSPSPSPPARYVLRIYNNGFNTQRVLYEHSVLTQLAAKSFSFSTPALLPARADGTSTFVELSATRRTHACLFRAIPGGGAPSTLQGARNIGRATAELVRGMRDLVVENAPTPLPNPLYRNIYDAHAKLTRASFYDAVAWPDFTAPDVKPHMDFLLAELAKAEALVERCTALGLPEQQIHADLHFDNVLADGDEVTGLLDFEFTARDWTVMEMCVGLSKYLSVADADTFIAAWAQGYKEGGGRLTATEAELVPDLLVLRILSNVVYFVGRAVAGEDSTAPLTSRAELYAKRVRWVYGKREWMVGMLRETLVE